MRRSRREVDGRSLVGVSRHRHTIYVIPLLNPRILLPRIDTGIRHFLLNFDTRYKQLGIAVNGIRRLGRLRALNGLKRAGL
jgi:hypothetical protein